MKTTTLQERVMIQDLSRCGWSVRQIAKHLGLSLSTVRKWRRKGRNKDLAGLESVMGRPTKGAMSTFSLAVVGQLRQWRQAHPGWGPKTLRTELDLVPIFAAQRLPSQATITRWLKQEQMARRYEKHHDLPAVQLSPVHACHEEWEMDARGAEYVPNVGVVALIDLNDVFSRVKLLSFPCLLGAERVERHPDTADYQWVLRLSFLEWGLPGRIAVDRESIFRDNTSQSPFPTRLHLWIVALDVDLVFGRVHQPRDQAVTERSHQTWQHQVLEGQVFSSWEALWSALNQRRTFLNWHLPCASLGELPPLVAYPQARCSLRPYRPEWEAELLDTKRVYAYLQQGRWFRKASNVGAVALGDHRYGLGKAWSHRDVEITFDREDQHFLFESPGLPSKRLPAQGLTPQSLMGETETLLHLTSQQLVLPFSWDEWRNLQFHDLRGATTL